MEVNELFHASAELFSEKEAPIFIWQEAEWAPEPVRTLWKKENSIVPASSIIQPVA
jgi:hypothetical protein